MHISCDWNLWPTLQLMTFVANTDENQARVNVQIFEKIFEAETAQQWKEEKIAIRNRENMFPTDYNWKHHKL